jgi:hypothetical protein
MDLSKALSGLAKTSEGKRKNVVNMGKGSGFKAVQSSIAQKQGISPKSAGAILAASTRNASPSAKKANPNLKKVK